MITKDLLRALRADMDAALAAVGAAHGVTLRTGNATFSAHSATLKVELRELGAPAPEAEAWHRLAQYVEGLDVALLNRTVKFGTGTYRVDGLKTGRGPVKVALTRVIDGKAFQVRADRFTGAKVLA